MEAQARNVRPQNARVLVWAPAGSSTLVEALVALCHECAAEWELEVHTGDNAPVDDAAPWDACVLIPALLSAEDAWSTQPWRDAERIEALRSVANCGKSPILLLSHLDALGEREGTLFESDPCEPPYPLARALGPEHWDLHAEIKLLRERWKGIPARLAHAAFASRRQEQAAQALRARKEPASGKALQDKIESLFEADCHQQRLREATQRARGWGFSQPRGYLLALVEQTLARADGAFAIVRSGPLGAAMQVPHKGALPENPVLLDLLRNLQHKAQRILAQPEDRVELLPLDVAAGALRTALLALLQNPARAPRVVHAAPAGRGKALEIARLMDLLDLHLRKSSPTRPARFLAPMENAAPKPELQKWAERAARSWLRLPDSAKSRAEALLPPLQRTLDAVADLEAHPPRELDPTLLVWREEQRLRAQNALTLERQLFGAKNRPTASLQDIDWRRWLLDVHLPALDGTIAAEKSRPGHEGQKARAAYDNLLHLVEEAADRAPSALALSYFAGNEQRDVSYRAFCQRARAAARRLQEAGVEPGARVLISGLNHPDWSQVAFGVLYAGATLVPVDPALTPEQVQNIARRARIEVAVVDKKARTQFEAGLMSLSNAPRILDLHLTAAPGPAGGLRADEIEADALASLLFTSGTTGDPKGVMLSHRNFASLISSLSSVFDLAKQDRLLSVLPLHHTFEFSCGLLLPLAAGAQVYYLDELSGERLLYALKEGRITAMVGVPALWQLLERRLKQRLDEVEGWTKVALQLARGANRLLKEEWGVDASSLLFRRVHQELGGHLRTLISGGAALPKETHRLFAELGLPLAEGYGLTEAAPVLSVASGTDGDAAGTVGRAIPGVELQLRNLDDKGVGEVVAKGGNVMRGYFENEEATRDVLDADGWLRTGDLGRFDDDGRLVIVGRAKDVVVTSSGENIYLDDVEDQIGEITQVKEYTLLGVDDPKGGERLALVWVPADRNASALEAAKESLGTALRKLPVVFRPSIVDVCNDDELPKTATLKVKRRQVKEYLNQKLAAAKDEVDDAKDTQPEGISLFAVRNAIAAVAGMELSEIAPHLRMAQDLAFDSLMWVELAGTVEPIFGKPDPERLHRCESVLDVANYLGALRNDASPTRSRTWAPVEENKVQIPGILRAPARRGIGFMQSELYRRVYETVVAGASNIPQNQTTIVVANHCSHLDTGLVKYALGQYGNALTPLAAKDYFFEGNPYKVAFFEQLTNLAPIDRESGSGLAFEQAVDVVKEGRVVLIFPEGTRREDGTLGGFKPLVGRLSLTTQVAVLPMHLSGTYEAFPRGAKMPKRGTLRARIGPPLDAEKMAQYTADLPAVQSARVVTEWIRSAVAALAQGRALSLEEIAAPYLREHAEGQATPSAQTPALRGRPAG